MSSSHSRFETPEEELQRRDAMIWAKLKARQAADEEVRKAAREEAQKVRDKMYSSFTLESACQQIVEYREEIAELKAKVRKGKGE